MFEVARRQRMVEVAHRRLAGLAVAAEHTYHRHNISALLRSADAAGVFDVHLIGERPLVPSVGPSRGVARWLRLHHHTSPVIAADAIRAAGYRLWVADFSETPVVPEAVPLDAPVCVWFGAELLGVSPEVRARADGVVTLPMRGMVQSLNLAAAATAVLHVLSTRLLTERGEAALLAPAEREALAAAWVARDVGPGVRNGDPVDG